MTNPRCAFAVHWALKDDAGLAGAGIATADLAREIETQLARFPDAATNADDGRRLRGALYRPLLALDRDLRKRFVDKIAAILLDGGNDQDD